MTFGEQIKRFLTQLVLGANLCTLGLMWICILSTYLPPSTFPHASLLGLAFPVFLVTNIAFCLFWLIFKAKMIFVPLLGMALAGGFIMDYSPLNFKDKPTEEDSTLCVMSFNLDHLPNTEKRDSFCHFISGINPDIICFQEFPGNWLNHGTGKTWMKANGYRLVQHRSRSISILTRLPLVGDTLNITYPTRNNGSLACKVLYEGDTLLVVSNHLESNQLTDEDKSQYKQAIVAPGKEQVKQSARMLARKMGEAARYRGAQTDTLCSIARQNEQYGIIMCGDFNDTPISYTYRELSQQLTNTFRESGYGVRWSYNQRSFPVRIDHIFISPQWESLYTYIDRHTDVSDHYPIITYLHKKQK